MNDAELYGLLADAILVVHFAIVVFVVFGFMLIGAYGVMVTAYALS